MSSKLVQRMSMLAAGVLLAPSALADSYRYLHVTIETPWMIFLVLLPAVLMPFILMAFLYWRHAMRRDKEGDAAAAKPHDRLDS